MNEQFKTYEYEIDGTEKGTVRATNYDSAKRKVRAMLAAEKRKAKRISVTESTTA